MSDKDNKPEEVSISTKESPKVEAKQEQKIIIELDPIVRNYEIVYEVNPKDQIFPILRRQLLNASFQFIELTIAPDWSLSIKFNNVRYEGAATVAISNVVIKSNPSSIALTQSTANVLASELNRIVLNDRLKKAAEKFLDNERIDRINSAKKLYESMFKLKASDADVERLSSMIKE